MPTLEENVNRVKAAKTAIGNAITAKGGTVGANDGLEDFAADVATIPSGGVEFSNSPTSFTLLKNITNLDVIVPNGVTEIAQSAFSGCTGLKSIMIPDTVRRIRDNAFISCINLTNYYGNNYIIEIGEYAFYNCTGLKYAYVRGDIGVSAFQNCTALEDVDIINGYIHSNAFNGCTAMKSIKFHKDSPAHCESSSAWTNIPTTCKIYVPAGSLTAYTSAANYPDPNTYTYEEY